MSQYVQNLAISTVASPPVPAVSGTALSINAGEGLRFADPAVVGPYPATIWPNGVAPSPASAEIVLITAKSGDTLTITRNYESNPATPGPRAIAQTDLIAATITASMHPPARHRTAACR